MGPRNLQTTLSLLLCILVGNMYAQNEDNLDYLISNVAEGKTYYLAKANQNSENIVRENEGYYIKIVPAVYETVPDTVILSPPLNGNLDTSNYFIETEVLVLKEPAAEWKTARVSKLCMEEGESAPEHALCLLKMVPKYQIVNKKFFPFKNILDTSRTDFVIPAKTIIVEREKLVEKPKLERIPLSQGKPTLKAGEKLIKVTAGKWERWQEVVCPYGEFNDPTAEQVQRALKKQGYTVKITGSYDEQTRRILHEFQTDNMLEVGELSEETIKRLGVKRERLITVDYD
jgi:hypothetical protein